MQYEYPVLCRIFADPNIIRQIDDRYPYALAGKIDDMYIGGFTHSEAKEARGILGVGIRPLTREEQAKAWGH